MLQFRIVSILALATGAGFCLSVGCGSSDTGEAAATTATSSASSGGGGAGGAGGAGGQGGQGGAGGAPSCTNGDDVVLTVEKFYMGDENFEDQPDPTDGWRLFGHELDGLVTVDDFTAHCLPAGGGITAKLIDGDGGIDNSFGHNMLPVLNGLSPDFTVQLNDTILNGEATLMFKLDELGPGADQDPVVTKLYDVTSVKQATCWPVVREQLEDPTDIESTPTVFLDASVAGHTWTSGTPITVTLTLNFIGYPMKLTIKHARLSMELDPTHKGATLGQIGGVLDTEEFIDAYKQVVGTLSEDFCDGATFEPIANQIRQASDIMTDGTQDPQSTCNGISIGIGFILSQARIGGIAPAGEPVDLPCP